ncbi:putative basic helix-loop-helix leucine zipper transcription factor [Helianthus annuus]|nr:putative basic helix-loop-helix leucine zipper transcription factor [Helianthus annuus]KAJ0847342.1 putative basic helix-loop-helix leucine zipper transcription factor [Helianthus annuus]
MGIPQAWNSIFGMELETQVTEQIPNCFVNSNWDNSMDQSDPFESALSSIVSSPVNSHSGIPKSGGENMVLKELILQAVEEPEKEVSDAKRSKSGEEGNGIKKEKEEGNLKPTKENAKPEPPRDYIHVRARRGQATDCHSLAERVRREKDQ